MYAFAFLPFRRWSLWLILKVPFQACSIYTVFITIYFSCFPLLYHPLTPISGEQKRMVFISVYFTIIVDYFARIVCPDSSRTCFLHLSHCFTPFICYKLKKKPRQKKYDILFLSLTENEPWMQRGRGGPDPLNWKITCGYRFRVRPPHQKNLYSTGPFASRPPPPPPPPPRNFLDASKWILTCYSRSDLATLYVTTHY